MPEVDISEFDERLNDRECSQASRDIVAHVREAGDKAGAAVCQAHSTPELGWAKEAWGKVTKAGLAEYETEADRCRVFARFMVLASFYRDWCAVAHDERQDDEVCYWIDAFDYDRLHLGQAVGSGPEVEDEADAFSVLIEEERKSVLARLIGGHESESQLFVALWRSSHTPPDSDSLDYDEDEQDQPRVETDDEILNYLDQDKMAGFAWLSDGRENLGPVRFRSDD